MPSPSLKRISRKVNLIESKSDRKRWDRKPFCPWEIASHVSAEHGALCERLAALLSVGEICIYCDLGAPKVRLEASCCCLDTVNVSGSIRVVDVILVFDC